VIRLAQIAWQRVAEAATELGLYTPGASAGLDVHPLETLPSWPAPLRTRLDQIERRTRAGAVAVTLPEVSALLAEVGGPGAKLDAELAVRLAQLRFAAGDVRGALDVAIAVTRSAPHYQPAHLLVARLLLAAGDEANARNIFKETQTIYPLAHNETGIVQAADGALYLGPDARFRVDADLPDAELTLRLLARTTGGFRNLPIRIAATATATTSAGGRGPAAAVTRAELTRDQQEVTLAIPLPHRTAPVEIHVAWRGVPDNHLPGPVRPLCVQIAGMELGLVNPATRDGWDGAGSVEAERP
jgi:hypothetical protein